MSQGLTEADLQRIEQFVNRPRRRRRPDMLRPDEADDDVSDDAPDG